MNDFTTINELLNKINFIYYFGFLLGDDNLSKKDNSVSIKLKYEDMINITIS